MGAYEKKSARKMLSCTPKKVPSPNVARKGSGADFRARKQKEKTKVRTKKRGKKCCLWGGWVKQNQQIGVDDVLCG